MRSGIWPATYKGQIPNTVSGKCHIHCGAVITRSILSKIFTKDPHTSMMTSSNGNIFRVTDPVCGEFTGPGEFPTQRPLTRSFDIFFDLRLNKRLSKQPWGWWFEKPSWSLWRQCNASTVKAKYGVSFVDSAFDWYSVSSCNHHVFNISQRTHDAIITSSLRPNDVADVVST